MTDREAIRAHRDLASHTYDFVHDACIVAISAIQEREERQKGCDGCRWKGRHQKCSCCARNRYLKDCFEQEE